MSKWSQEEIAKRRWRIGKVKKMKSTLKETRRKLEKRLFEDKEMPNDEKSLLETN